MLVMEKLSEKEIVIEKKGRKDEVLALLKAGRVTVAEMAKKIGISERNISSQLSYLRKDGILIGTDSKGRKFIES